MRIIVQRTGRVKLYIDNKLHSETAQGLLVLFGTQKGDNPTLIAKLVDKTVNLRIFEDTEGKMNHSVTDISGEIMVVSQFTLYADTNKGRRPSFNQALEPIAAEKLYDEYISDLKQSGLKIESGVFGAKMDIQFNNDGPVTIIIDNEIS